MSDDINREILVELRKIRAVSRRMCCLIVVFITVQMSLTPGPQAACKGGGEVWGIDKP